MTSSDWHLPRISLASPPQIGISLDDKRNCWAGILGGIGRQGAIEPFELYSTADTRSTDDPPDIAAGAVVPDQSANPTVAVGRAASLPDGAGGGAAAEGGEEPDAAAREAAKAAAKEAAMAEREAIVQLCREHAAVLHSYGGILPLERVADAHKANRYPPLFVPNSELLSTLRSFFGLTDGFAAHLLVARSPTVCRHALPLCSRCRWLPCCR